MGDRVNNCGGKFCRLASLKGKEGEFISRYGILHGEIASMQLDILDQDWRKGLVTN